MSKIENERRNSKRKPVQKDMEFILYLDAFKASSVNLSDTGIRFDTEVPITIRLKMDIEGKDQTRDARLVWAQKRSNGGLTYGFEFIPDLD